MMTSTAALLGVLGLQAGQPDEPVATYTTDTLRWTIGADGRTAGFVDSATGADYCRREPPAPLARARLGERWHEANAAVMVDGALRLAFADTPATVDLTVTPRGRYLVATVTAADEAIDELVFLNVPLTLRGSLEEPFAACALALGLQTKVPSLPGPASRLEASCVRRFGLVGAAVGILACPTAQLRDGLKQVVSESEHLPKSPIGGPWALDARINRASYLFAAPTEQNVDGVIRAVKSLGFNQVEIHGGRGTYRFGDCLPNPQLYPRGVDSLKAVIDRLHAADIYVGMHPYAFFIDKATPWVTPVPDPGLAADATFTLAADVPADATVLPVRESTTGMSTITGFFVRNSVTLRIGQELITYSGLATEPPYAFTNCTRGALGTTASAHAAGEPVYHLKECFGLFLPDPDAPLYDAVVEANATFFNTCGFDTIYQDALDGEDTLGGAEYGWHYGAKFVWDLWARLERPAAMEYSTFHHHLWVLRSRHGAWDHPTRSHQAFVDQHVAANAANERMFLPSNLGWWAFRTWQPPQTEPTFPEDIEYWCAKALATDSGLSLMGYDPNLPGHQRLAAIVKRYEELRQAGYFADEVRARLRQPGAAFSLEAAEDGAWQFRPVHAERHVVRAGDGSEHWTASNPYSAQPPSLRIEALMAAGPYDDEANPTLAAFAAADEFSEHAAAPGVQATLEPAGDGNGSVGRLTATNSGPARRGAWASFRKTFDPPLNLSARQGLGIWVRGDGRGEVLNFQLRSPSHLSGAVGEHYVTIDFVGWRYVELIEHDSDRYADYAWPYPGGYAMYRELVHYDAVESLTIWCNHLPPGETITVDLRPVRALPLLTQPLVNPTLTLAGTPVRLPVTIDSGCYLELAPTGEGQLYGQRGEPLAEVSVDHGLPALTTGEQEFSLVSEGPPAPAARARVTLFFRGDPFR